MIESVNQRAVRRILENIVTLVVSQEQIPVDELQSIVVVPILVRKRNLPLTVRPLGPVILPYCSGRHVPVIGYRPGIPYVIIRVIGECLRCPDVFVKRTCWSNIGVEHIVARRPACYRIVRVRVEYKFSNAVTAGPYVYLVIGGIYPEFIVMA